MLFNSHVFLFIFLPICLIGYLFLQSNNYKRPSIFFLVICSLIYYAYWDPKYLLLILTSILINYILGQLIERKRSKKYLTIAVILNLASLAYYKYAFFIVQNMNHFFSFNMTLEKIVLPLAISFFTFQQIAFLVDSYHGKCKEINFINYVLFVCFFPQLIAGPIVHHSEMLPQFNQSNKDKICISKNLALGFTLFFMGLFKKVILADEISVYSNLVFTAADNGQNLNFFEAWGGALAYTLQIYFDFSGYSDMAVGLGNLFGIKLPINFFSPYKAKNIIEFWRRWHITLSRFLLHYIYIPLGGNRQGRFNRYRNLFVTMLLGGLWHGAGWTFVFWGMLHGIYLIINHLFQHLFSNNNDPRWWSLSISRILTFACIVFAWVYFRANSFAAATLIVKGMLNVSDWVLPSHFEVKFGFLKNLGVEFIPFLYFRGFKQVMLTFILLLIVWFAPNTLEIMDKDKIALGLDKFKLDNKHFLKFSFTPSRKVAFSLALISIWAILAMAQVNDFLYFQF